jgi:hypothetical protein
MSPRRRKSMERIRRAREEGECPINREQARRDGGRIRKEDMD